MVATVVDVIKKQFLNHVDEELQKDSLYNIVSGMPVDNSICKCLTSIFSCGPALMNDFVQRLHKDGSSKSLTDTIKRFSLKNFEEKPLKGKVSRTGNQKEIRIQRDILGKLVSLSNKHKSPIDVDAALSYPLAPISLPLCNADGSIRKTNKSSLFKAAMCDLTILNTEDLPPEQELSAYFLDLATAIRTQTKDFVTINQLAWRLINSVPSQYRTIFILCDTYIPNSIKVGERRLRRDGRLYVLKNTQMKLPSDMSSFLRNDQNKEMLFNLIEPSIYESKELLKNREVFFSNKTHCSRTTNEAVNLYNSFASDQKEADTKLVALVNSHDLPANQTCVMVRSPSGDIDILVLFLLHQFDRKNVCIC